MTTQHTGSPPRKKTPPAGGKTNGGQSSSANASYSHDAILSKQNEAAQGVSPRYFQGSTVTGPARASDARTFQDVVEKLRICPTLGITRKAFMALDKKKRNEVKQVPFFVPACFKKSPSKRVYTEATHCNLIFLDIDETKEGTCPAAPFYNDPDTLYAVLGEYNFAAYVTVSSTPEKPRMRIVVEANEIPVSLYPRAVATVAAILGLSKVTTESKIAVQPMFMPTLFSDSGEKEQPLIADWLNGRPFEQSDISDTVPGDTESKPVRELGADALEFLTATMPEITLPIAEDALSHISPDCQYDEWLDMARALKHQFSPKLAEEAFALFDTWSAGCSAKYPGSEGKDGTCAKWDSLRPTPEGRRPITIRTLLKRAEEGGWERKLKPMKGISVFYDMGRKDYWVQNDRKDWIPTTETHLRRLLRQQGISPNKQDGLHISPLDIELIDIQQKCDVHYAGPLAGYSTGVYEICGLRILVTKSPDISQPKAGEWPILRAFLNGLLNDPVCDQRPYFYGWVKVAYEALLRGERRPGQAVVMAGPHDSGKSLLQNLVTLILGGRAAKPYQYMSTETSFNSDMFKAEHLTIEDEQASTDIRARRNFGAQIKNITVVDFQRCHAKNRDALMLSPFWRLTISVNEEPENLMVLPPMDDSIEDKLMILRAAKKPMPMLTASLEQRKAFWDKLVSELPAFLHFITQFEIPKDLVSERFGITHFHHPEILQAINSLSPEFRLLRLIDEELFRDDAAPVWKGSAELLSENLGNLRDEARRLFTFNNACGFYLARLQKKFPKRFEHKHTEKGNLWTIYRDSLPDPMDDF